MRFHTTLAAPSFCLALGLGASGCSSNERAAAQKRIAPEYDKDGKLQLLKYDSTGSGRVDTWSYMDGARVVRIEIDKDGDGKIDRWEHYRPDQKLEKVRVSGPAPGRIDRLEYYEGGVIARAEEDTDGDGRLDKWETYTGSRLATVAFDTTRRGTPDRRLTYGSAGNTSMEVIPALESPK